MAHRDEIDPKEAETMSPRERVDEIIRIIDDALGDQLNAPGGAPRVGPATSWSATSSADVGGHRRR